MTRLAILAVLAGITYLALVAWSFLVLGEPEPDAMSEPSFAGGGS